MNSVAWMVSILAVLAMPGPLAAQGTYSVVSSGAVADGVLRTDGAMTAGSAVLLSQSSLFSASDVGKYMQVVGAGPGGVSYSDASMAAGSAVLTSASGPFTVSDIGRGIVVTGAGAGGGNLTTTIQGYTSATSVTLSLAAQTAVNSAAYYYGAMTLEATIQSVESASSVTLSTAASASISSTVFSYGTDNHLAFQAALDTVGAAGGGQVSVPAAASCPAGAVCGYVIKASDQMTASAPGAVKIRYSNVQLVGDASQTNLFCRGAYATYSTSVAFPGIAGNIRGYCLAIGDNGGPNGVSGESVSNVTISNLHLYGMTNGNTFRRNFAYPPTTSDGWDITHKAISLWVGGVFSNITIDSVAIQDFKAENIYSGGSAISGMVIQNSSLTNFNGDGISMLAADLQVLNNTISNGSNAAIENASASTGSHMLVRQLYQGNHFSLFPNEAIAVVGVDGGVASGSITISGNSFDTIGQINPAGARSAIEIGGQGNGVPPANVTVNANTCHDCYSFGVFQTSGNSVVEGNSFTVDQYRSNSVFSFNYPLSNITVKNNTGSFTANALTNPLGMLGDVYVLVPSGASGGYGWKNVIVKGNSWTFAGGRHYQFVTSSGPGWSVLTGNNLNWQGDVCTGCIHADGDHGLINLAQTSLIEPYGPTVYLTGNTSAVTATVDASKEEDGAQLQLVNMGSAPVTFVPDSNLSLPAPYTLAGGNSASLTLLYRAALGKYTLGNAAAAIVPAGGSGQSASVNTAFGAGLQAAVTDVNGYPVSGASVTFTVPGGGASASFSGLATATVLSNGSGMATAPPLTASGQAGAYSVIASVPGVSSAANFNLTNLAGPAASVAVTAGTPQSATVNTAFSAVLQATVRDGSGNPLSGVTVTFLTPASGASATFSGTTASAAVTNASGVASAQALTANGQTGAYSVMATVPGVAAAAIFSMTNSAAAGIRGSLTGLGNGATTSANLTAEGVNDWVHWGDTTLTRKAGVPAQIGSYAVVGSFQPVRYSNDPRTLTWTDGSPSASGSNKGGLYVNYKGGGFTLSVSADTATRILTLHVGGYSSSGMLKAHLSDSSAPDFIDNTAALTVQYDRNYTLSYNAAAPGQTLTVSWINTANAGNVTLNGAALTQSGPSLAATAGTPQSAAVNTAFGSALQAVVKDAGGNPLSGVTVTFTTPASGASASFSGSATATALTDSSGTASAAALTANGQVGAYTVTATAPGVATGASFNLSNLAGTPATITATAGTPQSTAVNAAFTSGLQATVRDAGGNPVSSGVTVTFSAPGSGASASFSGLASATALSNANGVATAPALTANGQSGSYSVTATVPGVAAAASFSLTNVGSAAASVTATAGTPQSASVNKGFATALQATVKAANNTPVAGVTVTFSAATSGASATFSGSATATALSNASGVATAPALTANSQVGAYSLIATVSGVVPGASFSLTNVAGGGASVTATAGTPQSAAVNTVFSGILQAVVKDAGSNPLSGVTVTFTTPANGASAVFSGSGSLSATAISNASGIATAPLLTANGQTGSYSVTASAAGVAAPASFSLTNVAGAGGSSGNLAGLVNSSTASANLTAEGANDWVHWGDTALNRKAGVAAQVSNYVVVGSFLPIGYSNDPRALSWTDGTPTGAGSNNNGIYINNQGNGFSVSATADTATRILTVHAGGWLSSGLFTAHLSDSSAPDFVDNNTTVASGQYDRNYTITYNAASAGQTLTVTWISTSGTGNVTLNGAALTQAGPVITATAGTPQSATDNTAFGTALQATLKDAGNNPLSGVTVTFSAPASGASGNFSGSATATALTNASGVATAPTLTANSQAGAYTVTATAAGAASGASFNLTNVAGTPAAITATSGTPQSAAVNTAFSSTLQATVKDAGNNPVSGVTVTFSAPASGASASFNGSATASASTNASGVAVSPALTANGQSGSYSVTASAPGVTATASFSLTNVGSAAASISASAGAGQSASVNTAFATALQATVKAANNSPVSGISVTFSAPGSGAGASFSGSATATALTNASGIATAPALTANSQAGAYTLLATVAGVSSGAGFSLTNLAGAAGSITASGGTPQSTGLNAPFATNLQAAVKDAGSNPVSGVTVTFSAPASGASASFGGSNTVTALTNASGLATAPLLTANGQTGSYSVTATTPGLAAAAGFSLTNSSLPPAHIKLVQKADVNSMINLPSETVSFSSGNTAGNWIGVVIFAGQSSTHTFTITDTNGNTYRRALTMGNTDESVTLGMFYAENIKAGPNQLKIVPNTAAYLRVTILEYSGVATANSLDVTVAAQGNSVSPNSGSVTTTANGDLLLAGSTTADAGVAGGPGYTVEDLIPASPGTRLTVEDQIQSAAGPASASLTLGATKDWTMGLAAFRSQ